MGHKKTNEYDLMSLTYALQHDPMFDNQGMHVEMMDPDWISVTEEDYAIARRPDKNGMKPDDYKEVSKNVSDVCDAMLKGEHLEDLMRGDSSTAQAARSYFDPKNMIRADVYGGDEIRLDGHGVQQLLAAQRANVPVPVYFMMQPEMKVEKPQENARRLPDVPYEDPPFMNDFLMDM